MHHEGICITKTSNVCVMYCRDKNNPILPYSLISLLNPVALSYSAHTRMLVRKPPGSCKEISACFCQMA